MTTHARKPPVRSQALHVIDHQLGVRVDVDTHNIPPDWKPDSHVPASRDECRDGPRPCTHVRCEHHLWVVAGQDRRGGRRGRIPTTLVAANATTCERDVLERRGTLSATDIGALFGISARRVQKIVKRALQKLKGSELREFVE